jgi:hypothetical protein
MPSNLLAERTCLRLSSIVHTVHKADYDEEDVLRES